MELINGVTNRATSSTVKLKIQPLPETESEFAATVAHELRTPLHTAAGFLSFLLQGMAGQLSPMQRDMLASVATSIEQAQLITEDLLCMAAIEQGQLQLDLKPLNLRELVREEMYQLRMMAEAANITLEGVNLEGEAWLVQGARNRLGQGLRNLLVNAVKFSPDGGTVRVKLEQQGGDYIVRVVDNGPGIRAEHLSRLFERHFRVNPDDRHLAGYGLGLSITKDLVEQQGGQVGVESEAGAGSCFWMKLPRI